ncbi:MAG TPA: hypothetical protein VFA75_16925 [Nevskia sp.]|nr:hypothetical protein [Nevskia sp.]
MVEHVAGMLIRSAESVLVVGDAISVNQEEIFGVVLLPEGSQDFARVASSFRPPLKPLTAGGSSQIAFPLEERNLEVKAYGFGHLSREVAERSAATNVLSGLHIKGSRTQLLVFPLEQIPLEVGLSSDARFIEQYLAKQGLQAISLA